MCASFLPSFLFLFLATPTPTQHHHSSLSSSCTRHVIVDRVLASRLHCRRYCISGLLPPESKADGEEGFLSINRDDERASSSLIYPSPLFTLHRHPSVTIARRAYINTSPPACTTRNRDTRHNTENQIDTKDKSHRRAHTSLIARAVAACLVVLFSFSRCASSCVSCVPIKFLFRGDARLTPVRVHDLS